MNILILMAGSDKDFCEKGYPKYLIEIQNNTMIISERSTLSTTARRSHTWLTKVSRTVHGSMPCLSRYVICDYKKTKPSAGAGRFP